ncbi:MAG: 30S ribosomal protein S20 [Rhodobacteraceae bacterium]|nr:30S ribosomal protein S20 [Paracoccaceae bacterium]
MANLRQSKKRARQTVRKTSINHARKARIRTFVRRVKEACQSGDREAATAALRLAQQEMMRGVAKGVLHKNTASRTVSRLSRRIRDLPT